MTRRAPAWLRVEGDPPRFVVDEHRAAVVRRIFADTVAGLGKHHIARDLNLEGVGTFGRAAGWHASYVQKILASSAVLGEFQPGQKPRGERRQTVGDIVTGYYPQIIDADLHAEAMIAMSGRRRLVAGRGRRLVNLFSGLATCGSCSSRMTFRSKGMKRRADGSMVAEDYLICDSYQRGRGCDNGYHFNYRVWEDGILGATLMAAFQDRHFASPEAARALEIELAERERALAADRSRADTALSLFVETARSDVKDLWSRLAKSVDEHGVAIGEIRARLIVARGAVSPDEHRRRIFALRDNLDDQDEDVRFRARSRVMDAVHGLVTSMSFRHSPLEVRMSTHDGTSIQVHWEEWGSQAGTTWTISAPPGLSVPW